MFFFVSIHDTIIGSFFFFQAEDGIRDATVTGVQTCALPISSSEYSSIRMPSGCGGPEPCPRSELRMIWSPFVSMIQLASSCGVCSLDASVDGGVLQQADLVQVEVAGTQACAGLGDQVQDGAHLGLELAVGVEHGHAGTGELGPCAAQLRVVGHAEVLG